MSARSDRVAGSEDGYEVPQSKHSIPATTGHRSDSAVTSARVPHHRDGYLYASSGIIVVLRHNSVNYVPGTPYWHPLPMSDLSRGGIP